MDDAIAAVADARRDYLREYALAMRTMHDPALQPTNGYNRCEHCHYTSHPCDVYELATIVLELMGDE